MRSLPRVVIAPKNQPGQWATIASTIQEILDQHSGAYVPGWGIVAGIEKAYINWQQPWIAYTTDGSIIVNPIMKSATHSLTGDPAPWPSLNSIEPWDPESENNEFDPPVDNGNGNGNGDGNGDNNGNGNGNGNGNCNGDEAPAIPFGLKVAAGVAVGLFLLRR